MAEERIEEISDFFNDHADGYEEMHLSAVVDGMEGKKDITDHLPADTVRILDLGAGTGLELEFLFERFPDADVTVVDISKEMLRRLQERFSDKALHVIVSDYFRADYGDEPYDAVISSMTMHHWLPEEKEKLYRKIYEAVRDGGIYVENDYLLTEGSPEQIKAKEECGIEERRRLDKENPSLTHVHLDLPLAVETEKRILKNAGFSETEEVWSSTNNVTLVSRRQEPHAG